MCEYGISGRYPGVVPVVSMLEFVIVASREWKKAASVMLRPFLSAPVASVPFSAIFACTWQVLYESHLSIRWMKVVGHAESLGYGLKSHCDQRHAGNVGLPSLAALHPAASDRF